MTPYEPVAFVDNNPALWGQEIDGLPVLDPDDAARRFGQDKLWLITVYTNSTVTAQCQRLGVPWVTCAELSWALPDPRPPSFVFGCPSGWPSPKNRSSRRQGCGRRGFSQRVHHTGPVAVHAGLFGPASSATDDGALLPRRPD